MRSGWHSDGRCIRSGISRCTTLDQEKFAPWAYTIACIGYDWVVAAYIFIYYRVASRRVLNPER